MTFHDQIEQLRRVDQLIRMKNTGSPRELAQRLGVSERSIYENITLLCKHFNCPIKYSRLRRTYYYTKPGKVVFHFRAYSDTDNIPELERESE
jgi:predicted DNA-binding transcriptional regulator YafY